MISLRELVVHNFWLKLLSLVLATLVWFVIMGNFGKSDGTGNPVIPIRPETTRDLQRPIIVMTSAENRHLFQVDPQRVSVKLRGDPAVLNNLNAEDVQAVVRLVGVQEPQGSFLVQVTAPREVSVQQIWPAHVFVKPAQPAQPTNAVPALPADEQPML